MNKGEQTQFYEDLVGFVEKTCFHKLRARFGWQIASEQVMAAVDGVFVKTFREKYWRETIRPMYKAKRMERLRAYLRRICNSICMNMSALGEERYRKKSPDLRFPKDVPKEGEEMIDPGVEKAFGDADETEHFIAFLLRIPKRGNRYGGEILVQVLRMQIERMSKPEICTELGITKKQYESIRKKIRKQWGKYQNLPYVYEVFCYLFSYV